MKIKACLKNDTDRANLVSTIKTMDMKYPINVELTSKRNIRSLSMNNLLWMWYSQIQNHLKETCEEHVSCEDIHEYFVELFLPMDVITINGRIRKTRKRTSKMSNFELREYMEQLEAYWAQRDLLLRQPNDLLHVG